MSVKYIYIAGPYTEGVVKENVAEAIKAASIIQMEGYVPFIPHLNYYWHELYPLNYEDWMQYDFAWLARCDAILRLPGYSPGAEREVQRAADLGIPVFYGLADLLANAANI